MFSLTGANCLSKWVEFRILGYYKIYQPNVPTLPIYSLDFISFRKIQLDWTWTGNATKLHPFSLVLPSMYGPNLRGECMKRVNWHLSCLYSLGK